MQLVTGLLFGSLLRVAMERGGAAPAKPADPRSPLLRMTHPIRTVHLLPGRVRFRAPALLGRPTDSSRVAESLRRIQGVKDVLVDARTGSVLIRYDDRRLEPEILFAALIRLLDLEQELKRPPRSLARREGGAAVEALNKGVFDATQGLLDLQAVAAILGGALLLNKLVLRYVNLASIATGAYTVMRSRGETPLTLLQRLNRPS